jgi:hypothetical protein
MWLSAACKIAGSIAQAYVEIALELTCLKAPALAAVLHVLTARGLEGAGTMLLLVVSVLCSPVVRHGHVVPGQKYSCGFEKCFDML